MSEYINKADLYNEIARLEEMARDTYLAQEDDFCSYGKRREEK